MTQSNTAANYKTPKETRFSEGEDTVSSSSPPFSNMNNIIDTNLCLGRWTLVNCEISAPFISMTSGEMITKRQINEVTGDDEECIIVCPIRSGLLDIVACHCHASNFLPVIHP